jgi:ribosomal protein L7Ae-like RNA K-turn-binding protein
MKIKAKLVTYTDDNDEDEEFRDFYFNAEKIDCWYIPNKTELGELINIFISGECFSIKQEPHIKEYLMEMFVEPSLKQKQ